MPVVIWILLTIVPAFIAKKKGRSFILWLLYSWLLFPIALIHSLLMKKRKTNKEIRLEYDKNKESIIEGQSKLKNINIPEQLIQLKKLLDEGIITQIDFDRKKKELLDL